MKKKVLVLMSTYNGQKYVIDQINSIMDNNDSYTVCFLIRDDGSTDNTINVIEEKYSDESVSIIKGNNIGSCYSYLELIKCAPVNYDYYAYCDQDDIWLSEKIEQAVGQLEDIDIDKPALYFCGQRITDENLNPLYEHKMDKRRSVYANCIFNQMAGCTAMFNRKMMDELKKHVPKDILGHDAWTYRLCASLGGTIIVDENAYILYRQHQKNAVGLNNTISSKLKRAKEYIFFHKPSVYAREILSLYEEDISDEMRVFLKILKNANYSRRERNQLLYSYNIRFFNWYLDVIFRVKLKLRKM
ncbi:MAG: glycosyltransferase [Lachnospiraceae bacterium]|nr:glycosyltransferase [Lachnospiraceae bacterium]